LLQSLMGVPGRKGDPAFPSPLVRRRIPPVLGVAFGGHFASVKPRTEPGRRRPRSRRGARSFPAGSGLVFSPSRRGLGSAAVSERGRGGAGSPALLWLWSDICGADHFFLFFFFFFNVPPLLSFLRVG